MPLFALANAGIEIKGDAMEMLSHSVPMGIMAGLLVGKQLGITLFTWVAVRMGLGRLSDGVTWKHIYGVSCLGESGLLCLYLSQTWPFRMPNLSLPLKRESF